MRELTRGKAHGLIVGMGMNGNVVQVDPYPGSAQGLKDGGVPVGRHAHHIKMPGRFYPIWYMRQDQPGSGQPFSVARGKRNIGSCRILR